MNANEFVSNQFKRSAKKIVKKHNLGQSLQTQNGLPYLITIQFMNNWIHSFDTRI